jgi:hypothetical protein
MSIRTIINKGEVRTKKNGDKYIFMWNETQYCFPAEIWEIIKAYWGFIPNFPADFGAMYARFNAGHSSGRVNKDLYGRVNLRLKKELGTLYHAPWLKEKVRAYEALGDCGDNWIPPADIERYKQRNSQQYWLEVRKREVMSVYEDISRPNNFLECPFKVGDKVKIGITHSAPILFKEGGDKDNVVPKGDYRPAGSNKSEKGKSCFRPRYRTTDGDGYDDYVPAIVKSISALKVKLEYYKYDMVSQVQTSLYGYDETYVADWSAPLGKIVVGWGSKSALPTLSRYMKDPDTHKTHHSHHPR